MIRIDIDQRILDREDSCDQLRRKVYNARIKQARLEGHAEMRADLEQASYLRGWNDCMAGMLKLVNGYAKGDIS